MIAAQNHPINCGLANTSVFARQFTKQTIAARTADIILNNKYSEIVAGGSESVNLGDINYNRTIYPVAATNVRVSINYWPQKFGSVSSIKSKDTSILSNPDPSDPFLLQYQSTGTTIVEATLNTNEKILKQATTSTQTSATQDVFNNFLAGSLGRHIYDQIRIYANGSTSPPNHYPIYSTFDSLLNNYVKNAGHWASSLDFSGLMVNKASGGSEGVTMVSAITPYHAIGAAHYPPAANDIIYFCDSENQTIERTVEAVELLEEDICVVKFSTALPSTVKKYKTLPANYLDYFPINKNFYIGQNITGSAKASYLPIVVTSHYRWDADWPLQRPNRYAYIAETQQINDLNFIRSSPASIYPNNFQNYDGQPSGVRGGDSGGPCFFIINGDLVIVHHHVGARSGFVHGSSLSEIQAAIDSLGPSGQTYETVDLSEFTDFAAQ